MKGSLYLLPVSLGDTGLGHVLPEDTLRLFSMMELFIVENVRTARRFLRKAGYQGPLDDELFLILDEHTSDAEVPELLTPLLDGKMVGLMSEAGVPCVADPGGRIVREAHRNGIRVIPLTGPSSILLALMASGLNGQGFTFHGYLPVKGKELKQKILALEKMARQSNQTQIFMEAPYRNQRMLQEILAVCNDDTLLCIAKELTTSEESVHTKPISSWKKAVPEINKKNVVFLLGM